MVQSMYQQETMVQWILGSVLQKDTLLGFLFSINLIESAASTRSNEDAKDILNFTEIMKPIHLRNNNDSNGPIDPAQEKILKEEEELKKKLEAFKRNHKSHMEEIKI